MRKKQLKCAYQKNKNAAESALSKKENKMERENEPDVLPVYLYFAVVILRRPEPLFDAHYLRRFSAQVTLAAGMKECGELKIEPLPSKINGKPSVSFALAQQLKTSVQAIDTWPEKFTSGGLTVLLHSCQKFNSKKIDETITEFFPKAKIVPVIDDEFTYYFNRSFLDFE